MGTRESRAAKTTDGNCVKGRTKKDYYAATTQIRTGSRKWKTGI